MTKICRQCNVEQEENQFYKDAKTPGGYRHNCKICKNKQIVRWRELNRDRYNEIARQNNHKHYEKDRLKRYGLTIQEHDTIRSAQDNRCAICNKLNSSLKRDFATDHNHATGKVRGLLCYKCNRDMAAIDDSTHLAKLIAYRDRT